MEQQHSEDGREVSWTAMAAVFLLALALRAIYLVEYASAETFRFPIVDAYTYDQLARSWAAGAGLTDGFFWQPPFYPLLLSVLYRLTDSSMLVARIVGILVGSVTCALTCRLGARALGSTAGLIAGVITALYGPLIVLDGELLSTGWAGLWSVTLLLMFSALARPDARGIVRPLATGIGCGLAVLTWPPLLPFVLVGSAWLAWISRGRGLPSASIAGRVLTLGAGFLLVVLPVAALAFRVTGRASFLPASAGINLWIGNNPERDQTVAVRPGWDWDRLTNLPRHDGVVAKRDTSRYFQRRVFDYAISEPLDFSRGLLAKTLQLLSSRELPRNFDVYLLRDSSRLLRVLMWKLDGFGFPFGVLLPLALAGFLLHRPRLPALLVAFCLAHAAAIILVFVAGRYRAPLIPALAVAAAAGVLAIRERVRENGFAALALLAPSAAVIVLLQTIPGPFAQERTDYRAELQYLLGRQAGERGDPALALEHLQQAVALDPRHADAHTSLGALLFAAGRTQEATAHLEQALAADPDHAIALANLARVLAASGDRAGAEEKLRAALAADPDDPVLLKDYGTALSWLGRGAEGLGYFNRAYEVGGDDADLFYRWGRVLLALGQVEEARERLEQSVRLDPDRADAVEALAAALLRSGRRADAIEVYREAQRTAHDAGHPELEERWRRRVEEWGGLAASP